MGTETTQETSAAPELEVRQKALQDKSFRQRVLTEEKIQPRNPDAVRFMNDYEHIYVMDDDLSYEPGKDDSVAARAKAQNVEPIEIIMDVLRDFDQVAYVRFASVYREFKDVRDFVDELQPMLQQH